MTPAKKLAIIVAVQFLVLFAVLAFKQYTVWTGETVLLKVQPIDPHDLVRGEYVHVEYEISTIDEQQLAGDDDVWGTVYVEIQRGDDSYWHTVAVHLRREHAFDGTELIKGEVSDQYELYRPYSTKHVEYGIEDIFVPEGSAGQLPAGRDHTVAVEVKVDRFGNGTPRHFVVDGQPVDLRRR